MKHYESIPYYGKYNNLPIIAFDKLDGSNIRLSYNRKKGFYKFGTRKQLIEKTSEPFGFAIDLFLEKYNEDLSRIFSLPQYKKVLSFTVFAELVSKGQFGQHDFDFKEDFDIVLFDVDQYKKGFVPPPQFVDDFGQLDIPRIVYEGDLTKQFIEDVQNNIYNLDEGVICKGVVENRKLNNLYYCKIKTRLWLETLKARYADLYQQETKEFLV
jgi:hypothetical protein